MFNKTNKHTDAVVIDNRVNNIYFSNEHSYEHDTIDANYKEFINLFSETHENRFYT